MLTYQRTTIANGRLLLYILKPFPHGIEPLGREFGVSPIRSLTSNTLSASRAGWKLELLTEFDCNDKEKITAI